MEPMLNLAQQQSNDNSDFLPGDVVVPSELDLTFVLPIVVSFAADGEFWETDHRIGRVTEKVIRSASPAELKAKHRLDEPVALFVSGLSDEDKYLRRAIGAQRWVT